MANKQFEMLFALGAKLNSTFQGTFSSAQKVLQATQKELAALNKVNSDISSYQRQQAGLEKSKSQLQVYRDQLANTRDALQKLSESENASVSEIKTLKNEEVALAHKIENTELAITDKTKRLDEMQQKLADAGVDTRNLTSESERLSNEIAELAQREEQAANEAATLGINGQDAFDALGSALVASGIIAGLSKLAEAYKECVELSMEFESTMSTLEALSGANAQEMRLLSEQAKQLGATTAFTANQSAEAMTYMGMAGWNAQQMMSGMDGVIALAAASGEDLAMVSDIVTDNLTAFGLTAADTAHFADVLAAAATNSNTSVSIMGETFKGSASVAGALGYSIEDVAVMTGLMANAGVKGSIANTALKNTFNGLLKGVTLTGAALGEVEFTAVNADGTMKGLSGTVDELRGYFDQMTESEKVNNAIALAGQRGYNGLLAILNATDEDYASLTDSINNCSGAAQRMADIKLDNLQGDVTLLNSAADGLRTTLGGMYDNEMRSITQIGTEILTGINDFCEKNPALVKGIMAVVAGLGLVVGGYTTFVAIKKAKNALDVIGNALTLQSAAASTANAAATTAQATATVGATTAQTGLNLAMLKNPAVIITASIIALVGVLTALREACKLAEFEEREFNTATNEQRESVEKLTSEYENACAQYGETSDQARALKYDLDEATAALDKQTFSVSELYAEIDSLHDSTAQLTSAFSESTSEIAEQQEDAQILAAKLKQIATSSDTAAEKQAKIEPIVERLNALYPELGLTVENCADKMDTLSASIDRAAGVDTLQAKYKSAKEQYASLLAQQEKLAEASKKAEETAQQARKQYTDAVGDGNVFKAAGAMILGTASDAGKALDEAEGKAATVRSDLLEVARQIAECEAAFAEYGDTVNGTSDELVSAYDAVSIAVDGVTEETTALLQAYNDAYQAAYDSVTGQYNLWTQAEKSIPTSIDTINSALSSQQDYWSGYNSNLEKLLGKTDDIDGLRDVLASFADGSTESVNAIAGMAKASDEQLKEMVENYQKTREEEEKVATSLAEIKVDLKGELDEITDSIANTIDNMNMSSNAEAAAKDTINAYIDAIRSGAGSAGSAAEIVANAVSAALSRAPQTVLKDYHGRPTAISAYDEYAEGTDYAASGWALVGEEGPELVQMRGGEKVYTAAETSSMFGGNKITISPNFVINGSVGADTEQNLREFADQLVDMVKDALDEAGIDKRRSVYA